MGVKTVLTCDKCEDTLELTGPYHVAKEEMAEEGWINRKIDDEWTILCPKCKGKRE
jgi:Zn finger protein HypA/HybF involved in hydrogenase expression